jgi:hypothetical protein
MESGVDGNIVAASAARIALRPAESSAAALDLAASAPGIRPPRQSRFQL